MCVERRNAQSSQVAGPFSMDRDRIEGSLLNKVNFMGNRQTVGGCFQDKVHIYTELRLESSLLHKIHHNLIDNGQTVGGGRGWLNKVNVLCDTELLMYRDQFDVQTTDKWFVLF